MGGSLFSFLHAADIHLDSPLRGLARYEDAPVEEVRGAPRRAFEQLVDFAIDREVAFVLLVGDLYDGDWKDYNTGLFFLAQMRRLEAAGIGVHLVAGNHDAASQITRQLTLPTNVTLYSHQRPQTVELDELGVAIHGQSFAKQSVSEDLAASYPTAKPGRFEIGLLHTSLDGRPGHADYAPCSVAELRSKGYDYWALGHVHQREIVASGDPWIVFPGNLQGRHARETGAKGATLVSVEAGEIREVEHHAFDVVRWARIELDLTGLARADETIDRVREALAIEAERADGRLLAARLVFQGQTDAHHGLLRESERWLHEFRAQAAAVGGAGVFLEKVDFETRRLVDLEAELARDDALGDLMRLIAGLEGGSLELDAPGESFRDLRNKLPPEWLKGPDGFDPTQEDQLLALLPGVRELLLTRLMDAEEPS